MSVVAPTIRADGRVAFVLATHNRRDVLLDTLSQLRGLQAETGRCEVFVVDNASGDGTPAAVRARFPEVQMISLRQNRGACAKALGAQRARSEFVVFLDDDSRPRPGSVSRMVKRFEADARLGAASFVVHLPDGRCECSALPNVPIGCAVGFRREALETVGGLDGSLFMAAEEYDLAFRLVRAGWRSATFPDLHADHLKAPQGRASARLVYLDTRNNLLLAARYLPGTLEGIFLADWRERYRWLAEAAGHRRAWWTARLAAALRRRPERARFGRWRLDAASVEYLFRFDFVRRHMAELAASGVRTVILADLGKNIYPFVLSAAREGICVACVADDRFAGRDRAYRGIAVRTVADALRTPADAIVVSNTSPVHAAATGDRLAGLTSIRVHRWFGYDRALDE